MGQSNNEEISSYEVFGGPSEDTRTPPCGNQFNRALSFDSPPTCTMWNIESIPYSISFLVCWRQKKNRCWFFLMHLEQGNVDFKTFRKNIYVPWSQFAMADSKIRHSQNIHFYSHGSPSDTHWIHSTHIYIYENIHVYIWQQMHSCYTRYIRYTSGFLFWQFVQRHVIPSISNSVQFLPLQWKLIIKME